MSVNEECTCCACNVGWGDTPEFHQQRFWMSSWKLLKLEVWLVDPSMNKPGNHKGLRPWVETEIKKRKALQLIDPEGKY